jgi:hypothetical protein
MPRANLKRRGKKEDGRGKQLPDFHSRTKSVNRAIIPLPPARNGGHPQGGGFREIVLLNDFPEEKVSLR